jgi:hypothetical protein
VQADANLSLGLGRGPAEGLEQSLTRVLQAIPGSSSVRAGAAATPGATRW